MKGIFGQADRVMLAMLWIVLTYPFSFFRPRHDLALEVLALRHQLMVLQRQAPRPKLHPSDRYLWLLLMKVWPNWRTPLMIFQPETLIGWQRAGSSLFSLQLHDSDGVGRKFAREIGAQAFRLLRARDNPSGLFD